MATTDPFVHGRLYDVPLDKLRQDPDQSGKFSGPTAIDGLTASIRKGWKCS